jgi:hypothetical protein
VDTPPRLSDEENRKVGEWFQSKQAPPICRVCGRSDYSTYRLEHEMPLLALRCEYCAHVLFFDPLHMGI